MDEYQDTNSAQDMIFLAVSRQGENLFMVGDVKQSIYRFRQAMPEIFMEKLDRYGPFDGKNYPAKNYTGQKLSQPSGSNRICELCVPAADEPENGRDGVQPGTGTDPGRPIIRRISRCRRNCI